MGALVSAISVMTIFGSSKLNPNLAIDVEDDPHLTCIPIRFFPRHFNHIIVGGHRQGGALLNRLVVESMTSGRIVWGGKKILRGSRSRFISLEFDPTCVTFKNYICDSFFALC